MTDTTAPTDLCPKCGGPLVDEDDYLFSQAVRRSLAAIPVAMLLCAVWAPVFSLPRVAIGGGFSNAEGSTALFALGLILRKLLVGAVLGIFIGIGVGIWRAAWGLFVGAVIGSLGGFFVAATYALPLRSEAQHRLDVVLVAVLAGVLGAVTAVLTDSIAASRFAAWIGPEPVRDAPADGAGPHQ